MSMAPSPATDEDPLIALVGASSVRRDVGERYPPEEPSRQAIS
jgi:hypothetical protein